MPHIHHAAANGFATAASQYSKGRPDYPSAIGEWLRLTMELAPGKSVLELGAGTGKFTTRLAETGADVTALEPVREMREMIAHAVSSAAVCDGTAEAIPLADASVDAVVCAQSFHWFATGAAMREIHRVLKPGGRLGLIWNVRDESVPWVSALSALIAPYQKDAPRYHSGAWRRLFPAPGFGPLLESRFTHAHTGPAEQVIVDRTLSVSFIAILPASQQNKLLQQIHELIRQTPELSGKDNISFPYETFAFCCTKEL